MLGAATHARHGERQRPFKAGGKFERRREKSSINGCHGESGLHEREEREEEGRKRRERTRGEGGDGEREETGERKWRCAIIIQK